MSSVEDKKREAELLVYGNFGRAYAKALDSQASLATPEKQKVAAAAIVATGHATANTNATTVNRADAANGRDAIEKAYGARADDVAAVLSGRVAGYDLPKSLGGTQDLAALATKGQMLAQQATRETYASRGLVMGNGRSDYLTKVPGREADTTEKLANHLLHVKSAIESGVDSKVYDRTQADALYQRFQNVAFDGSQNNAAKNPDFARFEKSAMPSLRTAVMKDVEARYEMQSSTIDRARAREGAAQLAPRQDMKTNHAATAAGVEQGRANHLAELKTKPAFANHTQEDLTKLAFYRALVADKEKASPAGQQAALTRFDTVMQDPARIKALPSPDVAAERTEQTAANTKQRDTGELSR